MNRRLGRALHWTGAAAIIGLAVFVVWGNVYVSNQLRDRDVPAVGITPGSPIPGPAGPKGDRPSQDEIEQAVEDYCAANDSCDGQTPSAAVVYAAITEYCLSNNCVGATGSPGSDAPYVTDSQIQAQVATFCANNNCQGKPGETGIAGVNGREPVLACVIRTTNTLATRYVAWRYVDETDQSYRDLYTLPFGAECNQPVDLREEPINKT